MKIKKCFYISVAFSLVMGMTSCKEDNKEKDEPDQPEVPTVPENPTTPEERSDVAFILNQGNFYNAIEGGLSVIDYKNLTCDLNVFKAANKRSLGDTPQCGVAYGSKIYVGTSASNTIEIMDRSTYLSYKQIRLAENPEHGTSPYSMVAYNGKVFISMYDGKLARLDTLTMSIDKSVEVGPNPDQIAMYKGKIFVPLSDGMNYPNYGTTATVVDPETMNLEKTFSVGLNPTCFISTGDHLFLLCKGNYADIASKLYEINADYSLNEICNATLAASYDNKVAIIDEPFTQNAPVAKFMLYNTADQTLADWEIEQPDYANQIHYDAVADRLLIASYVMNGTYPSYDLPGYVNVYNGTSGKLLKKCEVGAAGPACIFTGKK